VILGRLVRVVGWTVVLAIAGSPTWAQPRSREQTVQQVRLLGWQRGPSEARIGGIATIKVPEGQAFLDAANTRRFLELTQNPPRDNHYTLADWEREWFAIFYFQETGYIKDDEALDEAALLRSLQESDGPANQERQRLGMPAVHTVGWHVAPHYDTLTKRLEWGVRLQGDDGKPTINYTIRLLGRRGVMHATLVAAPEGLDRDIADFKSVLAEYSFVAGEKYSEFRAGDRVAEYGLAALVLGGAAAVATKSGFGKALGKFVLAGVVALGGAITAAVRKLFRRG